MKWKVFFLILFCRMFAVIDAQAQTIHVSVAASMTDAFKEIMASFTLQHPYVQFLPNFSSSGSMAKQIEQGAPADIYVSANPKWMDYLVEKQMIEPATEHIFAYNGLAFIGQKESTILSLKDLLRLDRIALGNPQNVPAGQYAKQAMDNAGIYGILKKDRKLIMAKDVRQALLYADQGEVDGSFVYTTDALLAAKAEILFIVPDELHERIAYPLALTAAGAKNEVAVTFHQYLQGPEVRAILKQYGFETRVR
jgi:molybdate transport system substrate-binding protein